MIDLETPGTSILQILATKQAAFPPTKTYSTHKTHPPAPISRLLSSPHHTTTRSPQTGGRLRGLRHFGRWTGRRFRWRGSNAARNHIEDHDVLRSVHKGGLPMGPGHGANGAGQGRKEGRKEVTDVERTTLQFHGGFQWISRMSSKLESKSCSVKLASLGCVYGESRSYPKDSKSLNVQRFRAAHQSTTGEENLSRRASSRLAK